MHSYILVPFCPVLTAFGRTSTVSLRYDRTWKILRRGRPSIPPEGSIELCIPQTRQMSLLSPQNMLPMPCQQSLRLLPQRTRRSLHLIHSSQANSVDHQSMHQILPCSVRTLAELKGHTTAKIHRPVGLGMVETASGEVVGAALTGMANARTGGK